MKKFKSKIEKLKSKISEKNLLLLSDSECNSEYKLEKLLDWQKDYNWVVDWYEFKKYWFYCDTCKNYKEGHCICFAR